MPIKLTTEKEHERAEEDSFAGDRIEQTHLTTAGTEGIHCYMSGPGHCGIAAIPGINRTTVGRDGNTLTFIYDDILRIVVAAECSYMMGRSFYFHAAALMLYAVAISSGFVMTGFPSSFRRGVIPEPKAFRIIG